MSEKLKEEWSGILSWIIAGCLLWQQEGLVTPESVLVATKEYMAEEDACGRWLDECCLRDPQARTASTPLYDSWKGWAEANGEHVGSHKNFAKLLANQGFAKHEDNVSKGYIGLKLNPAGPEF